MFYIYSLVTHSLSGLILQLKQKYEVVLFLLYFLMYSPNILLGSQHSLELFRAVKNKTSVPSVSHSCTPPCNPMDCSTPGFPVHHQLPEPTQTHVRCVDDAIQPSHPLSFPNSHAFNLS